jgi:hypothetical protein
MKNLKHSLLLSGLLLAAWPSFAQIQVPFTTFAAAVGASSQQTQVRLTAVTANGYTVTAGSTVLYAQGESMFVNAVNGLTVSVTRGQPTSRVVAHNSGETVFFGPPNYFYWQNPVGYPAGACTRPSLIVPYIDADNNIFSDCVGGTWTRGVSGNPGFELLSANSGGTAYTSLNTNGTATVAGTLNCAELDVKANKLATGLGLMFGTTAGGTDKHLVALLDASGNVLATSALAGAANSTASTYVRFAFTGQYLVVGPAQYFACTQSNGTTDTIRMLVTGTQDTYLTTSKTGTFGTIPAITPPTTFTTAVGPYMYLY